MLCAANDLPKESDGQMTAVNVVHTLQWILIRDTSPAFEIMVHEAKGFLARRAPRNN